MTKTNSSCNEPQITSRGGKLIFGVIATIILGAIGSGLWDLLFKPGIGHFGRFITGISKNIDNSVFSTAALNPLPLSSIILVLSLTMIPLLGATFFVQKGFLRRPFHSFLDRMLYLRKGEKKEAHIRRLRLVNRVVASCGIILCLLVFSIAIIAYSVLNEAVFVWRTFHMNMDICAPFVPPQHQTTIKASFRLMKTRSDFSNIKKTLDVLAAQNSMHLEWYEKR